MRKPIQAAGLLLVLGTMAGVSAPARAQCTYTTLVSGTSVSVSATPQAYSFNQMSQFWTAVGVRSAASTNWNLAVYQTTAPSPACVATSLAASTQTTGVDFVVGDFNIGHDAVGLYYPQATRVSGTGGGTVEWDSGTNSLVVNGPLVNRTTDANDVLEVWDVSLQAGHTYQFQFSRTGADVKLLLFKSGAGTYWAARSATLFPAATGNVSYTPTTSGFYGVVVVNDNGVAGSYSLGVGECRAPDPLNSGVSVSTAGLAERTYSIEQNATFFTVVGVRGASNWNVEAYAGNGTGTYPSCLSSLNAGSTLAAPNVDFVVGNWNGVILDTFYARAFLNQDQGSGSALVEWEGGADYVAVGGDPIDRNVDASYVVECRDVFLNSGQNYSILFNTTGANLQMFLFDPGTNWAGRSAAVFQHAGSPTYFNYAASATGFYGLVITNEDGGTGNYHLRINQGTVDVPDGAAPVTQLQGMAPNPARGPARIHFALHEPAAVSFQVIDVAGRVVSETTDRSWSPGRWSVTWDGKGRSGEKLAAGVYFVRMRVAGQSIGLMKFALLD
jgi:hypothetical protein